MNNDQNNNSQALTFSNNQQEETLTNLNNIDEQVSGVADEQKESNIANLSNVHGLYNHTKHGLPFVSADEFCAAPIPPRKALLEPWLMKDSINMIYASRGVGKTYFSLALAIALAGGTSSLSYKVKEEVKVLYLDGEMPASDMQSRIKEISGGAPPSNLILSTPDGLLNRGLPDLALPAGRAEVEDLINMVGPKVVFIDNKSAFMRAGKENEADGWGPVQDWLISLRTRGITVILIHHAGKQGQQRGTSRTEDVMDIVINLKHPQGYSPEDGLCFEAHFEKARHLYGDDVKAMEFSLVQSNKGMSWQTSTVSSKRDTAIDLFNEGLPQVEIAKAVGVGKGTVSKWIKSARTKGQISE